MGSLMKERLKSQSLTEDLRETGEGEILRVFLRVIQVNRVLREDSLEPHRVNIHSHSNSLS